MQLVQVNDLEILHVGRYYCRGVGGMFIRDICGLKLLAITKRKTETWLIPLNCRETINHLKYLSVLRAYILLNMRINISVLKTLQVGLSYFLALNVVHTASSYTV